MLWNKDPSTQAPTTREIGQSTEAIAADYLRTNGLKFKAKNFQSRQGEIDLIMLDGNTWVFIEVKYRKNTTYGGAIAAISNTKIQKIRRCTEFFLQKHGLNEYNTQCRFDVITLEGNINHPQITWLKNAF
ncbi:MAG: YraN family protein [Alteromonadaceae bacterium]|nr:YraN family protein [Alteromonadaceae bacterium]